MDASTLFPPMPVILCPPPEAQRSIYAEWQIEAARYKWIMSEKEGRDLGDEAINQWIRDHWWSFLRARWMEHLHGTCFWIELKQNDFGRLNFIFPDQKELLGQIVERMKKGWENLDILNWAFENRLPIDIVRQILHELDMNSARLLCKFNSNAEPAN